MDVAQAADAGARWPLNTPGRNALLSALPGADGERVLQHCEKRHLELDEVFYEAGVSITHAYFPLSGFASLVTQSAEGGSVIEVGLAGNEGFVGVPLVLGADKSRVRAVCQAPGAFLSISTTNLKLEWRTSSALRDILGRYTHSVMTQMSQSVLCNNVHAMEQRLCRWLLAAHDRLQVDELPLTQTFLSQMLGVRRPSVTVVAGMLKKAGLVDYSRGQIRVLDRRGLEAGACECYGVIRNELDWLLSSAPRLNRLG